MFNNNFLPHFSNEFFHSVGNGFIVGQGLTAASSAYHSLMNNPPGKKLQGFISDLGYNSFNNGIEMAKWSIVSSTIEPYIAPHIQTPWLRSVVSGAATGALMEVRNGLNGIATGAFSGAMQSVTMSIFNNVVGFVLSPINNMRMSRARNKFNEKRNKAIFSEPIDVISKAFFE
ncbi:hypothetical protein GPJ56_001199 [Histomonas meleagridis]|uniref:uncharacterized protein n=1 Tax=Histomonas meleagridis TaxID=135588 RepID=UPI00355A6BA6|nr:hypothetical protein GPJ56_001199 [Histomonas meleagridis]KAH0799838.1 hypothetical protein GO595_006950 [Histomonas meleagridis]